MSSKTIIGFSTVFISWGIVSGCAQMPQETEPQTATPTAAAVIMAKPEPPALPAPQIPPLRLRSDHPAQYTVQFGDTIWTIAERYLDNPWRWRELWPQAAENDESTSLYPGDIIEVVYIGEQPRLRLVEGERGAIKLSPEVRVEYIDKKIPPITREAVKSFVDNSVVLSEADWKGSPYVVASSDGRNFMQSGTVIFARGADFPHADYRVFRPEGELRNPGNNAFLGFSLTYVGDATLLEEGDPARFDLISTRQPVRAGDRLLPASENAEVTLGFDPIPAPPDSNGQILQLPDDSIAAPRYSTVIINLGDLDGMRPGSVLEVLNPGRAVEDPLTGDAVDMPGEIAGLIVLYRVFDRVSYGLVTHTERPIRVGDQVREPL